MHTSIIFSFKLTLWNKKLSRITVTKSPNWQWLKQWKLNEVVRYSNLKRFPQYIFFPLAIWQHCDADLTHSLISHVMQPFFPAYLDQPVWTTVWATQPVTEYHTRIMGSQWAEDFPLFRKNWWMEEGKTGAPEKAPLSLKVGSQDVHVCT